MTAETLLTEKNLEDDIEQYLITCGGYEKGNPRQFRRDIALDTETLLTFIRTTQPKTWERYQGIYGEKSEEKFIQRVVHIINQKGLIAVLRSEEGVADRGCYFRLVYWKPETSLNDETGDLYKKNILHCTRQLHYSLSSEKSVDIVLFVNGIPVVSIELKNLFTGQNTDNAVNQYRFDRYPHDAIFVFKQRVLVHFAVDLYDVEMTTRLEGSRTRFLPFNQGSNGSGKTGGAGNPPSSDGDYVTAYLWRDVLSRDSLLNILHKFVQVEHEGDIERERIVFPRYHQLDVVRKLLADVQENGPGKNYLIQHSAGSGKSNSIAWLAHRLSGLYDAEDKKIFQSIIVVTDRKVLDSQLQGTVYDIDHKLGVVLKVEKNSAQLLDAINDGKQIIITTLQKFPVIYKEVKSGNRNFAIIVDEAHSSQSGESAKKLKKALASADLSSLEEAARAEDAAEREEVDSQDLLNKELESHGPHKNLSFFAFTATPKPKTLQTFGVPMPDGTFMPFHTYSMRQAIEEGFILDVLQNYTTYQMYYKILQTTPENPEIDSKAGQLAIKKFESLHPHNISQKTRIMIEHFLNTTRHQIQGKAKAMVVTSSRLHAIRYLQEFRRYIREMQYEGIDVLVAFSGTVKDGDDEWTEEKLNKTKDGKTIKEKNLPAEFEKNFNVLIVPDKYQTGFDEPMLHTMFVDKKLHGIKAVQTLSRLNRTMPGKDSTFVLDFVNTSDEIQESFQPYYETTILEKEVDPNQLYTVKGELDAYRVYTDSEVDLFGTRFFASHKTTDKALLAELSGILKPAFDRYAVLEGEKRDEFRSLLNSFIRLYSFVTQVYRLYDVSLEKFYRYAKYLVKILPRGRVEMVDVSDKVVLEYYKLEQTFTGSIALSVCEGAVVSPPPGGLSKKKDEKETLQEIISRINERFGTNFTNLDLVCEQLCRRFAGDDYLKNLALHNTEEIFATMFKREFDDAVIDECYDNQELFSTLMNNLSFKEAVADMVQRMVYQRFRRGTA